MVSGATEPGFRDVLVLSEEDSEMAHGWEKGPGREGMVQGPGMRNVPACRRPLVILQLGKASRRVNVT